MDLLCLLLPVIIFGVAFLVFRSLRTNNSLDSGWGNYYQKTHGLSSDEKQLLNKISSKARFDPFYRIDFCREDVIGLFLNVYRLFPVLPLENKAVDLFNYCTYVIRKKYNFQISNYQHDNSEVKRLESVIPDAVKEQIEQTSSNLPEITTEQQKLLYASDNRRWRVVLDELKANYSDSIQFYADIQLCESLNNSIVARRNLYSESYSFMVDKDRTVALKLYMCYLNIGSESETFHFRGISKKNQKILFANDAQMERFYKILDEYNQHKDLIKAFTEIDEIFVKKKKTVLLDEEGIKSAKNDLLGVVDLLNEYLEDKEKIGVPAAPIMENVVSSASIKVELNNIQIEFLEMFLSESCTLPMAEVDAFADSKGIFKSQLIDGINDLCYDILDDMLIEEDESNYTLNEKYYKQLMQP